MAERPNQITSMNTLRTLKRSAVALAWVLATPLVANAAAISSQTNFGDLQGVVAALFRALIIFIPAIAALYLVISGYRYIVAQGNPELVEKAKKSLTYAIIGLIVAFSSVVVINLFASQLGFPRL